MYHCGVKPAGSQVLNQRVPNESTTTLPIIASRLMHEEHRPPPRP